MGDAEDLDGALDAVDRWADLLGSDDRLAGLVYRSAFAAHLAGQLMVRSVELAEDAGQPGTISLERTSERSVIGRRVWEGSFLALPFEEALQFFRDTRVLTEAEFDALRDRYREGGFIARRLATQRLQEVARQSIADLLAQDKTIAEVQQAIRDAEAPEVRALGISPASPDYIDNVIRTNVATAYGHGRWEAMNDPNVVALRPYARYVTAGDNRVRENHRALHGQVFRVGSEEHAYYAPPLGYRCRCSMTTLSQRQLEARGYVVTEGRIPGVDPDEGWTGAPAPLEE